MVEVLEGPRCDDGLGVMRVRARALSDGKAGWVTGKGNQGTPFLQETSKPCYYVAESVAMQDGFPSEGCNEVRTLKVDEVVEVIEGPRKEVVGNAIRARGKAASDGATGWFTVKSRQGDVLAQPGRSTYRCIQGIALTDGLNIKECKVIRKLDKAEVVLALEGPVDDVASGLTRIKAKVMKDNAEGWLTIKGNAGTSYAEESGKHYVVSRATPMQSSFASEGGTTVRTLAEEESIEILEGPREERSDPAVRVHCRAVADGRTGWLTLRGTNLRPWTPIYRCLNGTMMGDAISVSSAKQVRRIEPDEELELLEGPREEAEVGVMRLKARAAKDGAVGWVTISGNQGKPFLEPVAPA